MHLSYMYVVLKKEWSCIISILMGLGDELMRTAIIFRRKGRISAVEKESYDPLVYVFFQTSACTDGATFVVWTKQSFV